MFLIPSNQHTPAQDLRGIIDLLPTFGSNKSKHNKFGVNMLITTLNFKQCIEEFLNGNIKSLNQIIVFWSYKYLTDPAEKSKLDQIALANVKSFDAKKSITSIVTMCIYDRVKQGSWSLAKPHSDKLDSYITYLRSERSGNNKDIDHSLSIALTLRSFIFLENNKQQDAERYLEEATVSNASNSLAFQSLAMIYLMAGEISESILFFTDAVKLENPDAMVHYAKQLDNTTTTSIPKNIPKSRKLIQDAATLGNIEARGILEKGWPTEQRQRIRHRNHVPKVNRIPREDQNKFKKILEGPWPPSLAVQQPPPKEPPYRTPAGTGNYYFRGMTPELDNMTATPSSSLPPERPNKEPNIYFEEKSHGFTAPPTMEEGPREGGGSFDVSDWFSKFDSSTTGHKRPSPFGGSFLPPQKRKKTPETKKPFYFNPTRPIPKSKLPIFTQNPEQIATHLKSLIENICSPNRDNSNNCVKAANIALKAVMNSTLTDKHPGKPALWDDGNLMKVVNKEISHGSSKESVRRKIKQLLPRLGFRNNPEVKIAAISVDARWRYPRAIKGLRG